MAKHAGFCIKTVLDKPLSEIVTVKDFKFGDALESVYPLLDIIFSYLNDKDLENVALVKKSWGDISERIMKKRPPNLCWVTCFQRYKSNFLKHSGNLHYNDAKIGIFLIDYRRLNLNKYICLHIDTVNLHRMTFAEYLSKEIVNKRMTYCLLSCPKVVSLFTNDISCSNGSIFDGILLPEIPGIRTTMFYCNPIELKKNAKFINNFIQENEELKCLLLFSLTDLHRSIDNLFKVLLKDSMPEDVAVGGGIIRGSKSFQNVQNISKKIYTSSETFCIAFLKKSNTNPLFNAASFVINGNDLSNEEFHEEVSKFRKRVIIRRTSIAFRICCGAKWEKDEESGIFNKYFPNTPLLGLEADGEIGWDSFNLPDDEGEKEATTAYNISERKPKKSKKSYPKLEHEWSTIFVLITWGEIIKE